MTDPLENLEEQFDTPYRINVEEITAPQAWLSIFSCLSEKDIEIQQLIDDTQKTYNHYKKLFLD